MSLRGAVLLDPRADLGGEGQAQPESTLSPSGRRWSRSRREPDSLFCVRPRSARDAARLPTPSDINVALGGEAEGGPHFAEGDIESSAPSVAARHFWGLLAGILSLVAVQRN